MQDIPFGQLLVLLAFILFPLLTRLLQRVQRRFEGQPPRQPPPQPAPRTFAKPPPVEFIASASERARAADKRESPPPRLTRPLREKKLLTSRRDLRRAIIWMTVLGPCRAVDPADAERRDLPQ
jgi:hypothetical protein